MTKARSAALVPVLVMGAVLVMIMPLPAALMDVLLAINISIAVLVMLGVVFLQDSLDFSVFPSLLLITTLMRLSMNVSSTRLILLDGYAGKVIETFGNFVVGGSVVVGLVVFMILIIIQFVVITNGAGRVAEVAARFTLDAMPGKQMAIDADLSAGAIDESEARYRRERISHEAEFYGAMDGASKFVKGDAIAGIIIVVINLIGGFAIGVGGRGLPLAEAMNQYSLLTIGDGLVSQIPALLISVSTGLLVTRVGKERDLGPAFTRELLGNPMAVKASGMVVAALALMPGLPKLLFLGAGGFLWVVGTRREAAMAQEAEEAAAEPTSTEVMASADDPEALIGEMRIEPLELHLSYDILDLIDQARGGDLLDRVRALRQQIAMDLGIVMPYVRTRDDVTLGPSQYRILLHGVEVASGESPQDRVLALPAGDGRDLRAMGGMETVEPVFGLPAWWINEDLRQQAAATGATVVDRSSVIVPHLAEIVRTHASDLLGRQQVQMLVEGMRYDEPLLANDVTNEVVPIALLHQVLGRLLADRVPIRDLPRVVQAIGQAGGAQMPLEILVNAARVSLGPSIVARIAPEGTLAVLTLEPSMEARYHEQLREVEGMVHLVLDPAQLDQLRRGLESTLGEASRQRHPIALVCSQQLRRALQRTIDSQGAALPVLAYPELPNHIELVPTGVIGLAHIDA